MSYFARFSPFHAIRDLRVFLRHRSRYELVFLVIAMVVTGVIVAGFVHDSHQARPYRREIIYVQQWPADRSDGQIIAQQKLDSVARAREKAELDKLQKARQAEFKKLDDKLKAWGL